MRFDEGDGRKGEADGCLKCGEILSREIDGWIEILTGRWYEKTAKIFCL